MSQLGDGLSITARPYEDTASLKKYIDMMCHKSQLDRSKYYEDFLMGLQTSTGTSAIFETTDSIAIAQIGKTEATIVLKGSADSVKSLALIVSATYRSNDGVSHTCTATGTATLSGTPIAFSPAITDFYALDAFTVSAANDTVTLTFQTAGGAVYGTISVNTTAATEAQMLGIGAIYGRTHTNHNDADAAVLTIDYLTPWHEVVLAALCTIDSDDGTTEIRFFKADTTTTVKDFHRLLRFVTATTPTANCHEYLITDANCANVDGSGGDIYGVMTEGAVSSANIYHYTPEGYVSWLANFRAIAPISAAGDSFQIILYCTLLGETSEKAFPFTFIDQLVIDKAIPLAAETNVYYMIKDNAGAQTISLMSNFITIKET